MSQSTKREDLLDTMPTSNPGPSALPLPCGIFMQAIQNNTELSQCKDNPTSSYGHDLLHKPLTPVSV